jgi:ABC-2 type transport system permease protein
MNEFSMIRGLRAVAGHELRTQWSSALAWFLPAAGMLAITLSVQPQMGQAGSLFQQKLDLMPKDLLVAFGVSAMELSDPVMYLATNFTLYMLLGGLFAALLGAAAFSREETLHTAELLLTQPVPRHTIALGKMAAGLALVAAFEAGLAGAAFGAYALAGVHVARQGLMLWLFVGSFLVHSVVYLVSLAATALVTRVRAATPIALALVFGSYGLGVVSLVSQRLGALRWLSPFRYAEPADIVATGALPTSALTLVAVAVLATATAVTAFNRRDIHA